MTNSDRDRTFGDALLPAVLDALDGWVLLCDRSGRVRLANKAAEQALGAPLGPDITDLPFSIKSLFDRLQDSDSSLEGVVAAEDASSRRVKIVALSHADEALRLVLIKPPLNGGGAARSRSESHKELLLMAAMQHSVAGIAAGLAHEINNPLSGITQSAQLLSRALDVDLPRTRERMLEYGLDENARKQLKNYIEKRDLRGFIDIIRDCNQRISRMVIGLLGFARGKEPLLERHSLPELVDSALFLARNDGDLKKRYGFKSVAVSVETPARPLEVRCDSQQIQQVILILVKNAAIRLYERGMTASGFTPTLDFRFPVADGREGTVILLDNGRALFERERAAMSRPFADLEDPIEELRFGLSICDFIVTEINQGVFSYDSHPEKGNAFFLTLPLARS